MLIVENISKTLPMNSRIKDTPKYKTLFSSHHKDLIPFKLDNISFTLPTGYIMGLVGLNGSGKSTLIKLILNLYKPDSGTVYINSQSFIENEINLMQQIGTVLDENLYPIYMTIEECGKHLGNFYNHFDIETFHTYCNKFHLNTSSTIKSLSKGQNMKFQLAFSLSHDARLFIMDEPTASLDYEFHEEFSNILADIVSDGTKSVLLSTQLTEDLDQIADYITLIDNGKLIISCTREELSHKYRLASGPDYIIKKIPGELIIHTIVNPHSSSSLIYHKKFSGLPDVLNITEPTLEEILYYLTKGGLIGK